MRHCVDLHSALHIPSAARPRTAVYSPASNVTGMHLASASRHCADRHGAVSISATRPPGRCTAANSSAAANNGHPPAVLGPASILIAAGARRVSVPQPSQAPPPLPPGPMPFRFQSIEVLALTLGAVNSAARSPFPFKEFWKVDRLALARALLSPSHRERSDAIEQWAAKAAAKTWAFAKQKQAIAEYVAQRSGRSPADVAGLTAPPAEVRPEAVVSWLEDATAHPSWRKSMRGVLQTCLDAQPAPIPQVERDGFAGELWACKQLGLFLPPAWRLIANGSVLSVSGADVTLKQPGDKGVKGEIDALLVDESGLAQGVVEVKLGGSVPFRHIYNDVRKLQRLMTSIRGRTVTLEQEGQIVNISQQAVPLYLVLRDGAEPMDGAEVVLQAERALLHINISMSLGNWRSWQGVAIDAMDTDYADLLVPPRLVHSMRRKVAKDFLTTLSSVPIYEMPPPLGKDGWDW